MGQIWAEEDVSLKQGLDGWLKTQRDQAGSQAWPWTQLSGAKLPHLCTQPRCQFSPNGIQGFADKLAAGEASPDYIRSRAPDEVCC